jgi:hypothetical protein
LVDILIGGVKFTPVLVGAPAISDDINAVCRILSFSIVQKENPQKYYGKTAELLYNGERWFKGHVKRQKQGSDGKVDLVAYDPCFLFTKHADDYYFKNQTANQIITTLARKCNIKVASIESTGAVFPYLYYPGADPDKIVIDVLARTKSANGRKFWFRYDPVKDGLIVFERKIPAKLWAFQTGINLLEASKSESIENLYSTVKLVHRESGKNVVKTNADAKTNFGNTQYFEEVNDDVKDLNAKAAELLADLSKVVVTMDITATNPKGIMKQFYTGDAIYIQEPNTGLGGGYYLRSLTQTFAAPDLIQIAADVLLSPELPVIQFEKADEENKKK